jgi:hypothetical protein
MKTLRLILGIGFTLCAGTLSSQAHGYGYGYGCFPWWPLATFGLGFGLGALTQSHAPEYVYAYPAYTAYPAYSYTTYAPAQPVYAQAHAPAQPVYAKSAPPRPAKTVPAASTTANVAAVANPRPAASWVPSTPGAGHWVPDPKPYSYTEVATPKKTAIADNRAVPGVVETVTIKNSPGAVRVVVVNR